MSAWILGIAGVIALTALAEILLPEGETAKYIKGVLAVFIVAAIIAPLPYLLDGSFSFEEIFATKEVETDEELLDKLLDMSEKQENSSAEKASVGIGGENRNIYITGSHQNDHAGEVNDGAKQIEGVYG